MFHISDATKASLLTLILMLLKVARVGTRNIVLQVTVANPSKFVREGLFARAVSLSLLARLRLPRGSLKKCISYVLLEQRTSFSRPGLELNGQNMFLARAYELKAHI